MQRSILCCLRPVRQWFVQTRSTRPTIKIGKDRFQITIDVKQFHKDEIRVKARPEYVLIQGKQERKTKRGFIIRQFTRKFKLPIGCDPADIESQLSQEGVLTITARRNVCGTNHPCETTVPVHYSGPKKCNDAFVYVGQETPFKKDLCEAYLKQTKQLPPTGQTPQQQTSSQDRKGPVCKPPTPDDKKK